MMPDHFFKPLTLCFIALLTLSGSLHAQLAPEIPEALLQRLYQRYLTSDKQEKQSASAALPDLISKEATSQNSQGYLGGRLEEAVLKLLAAQEKDEQIQVDYDLLVDGQDFEIEDWKTRLSESADSTHCLFEVTFTNFGEPRSYEFTLQRVEIGKPWLITEAKCLKGHEGRKYDFVEALEAFAQTVP